MTQTFLQTRGFHSFHQAAREVGNADLGFADRVVSGATFEHDTMTDLHSAGNFVAVDECMENAADAANGAISIITAV